MYNQVLINFQILLFFQVYFYFNFPIIIILKFLYLCYSFSIIKIFNFSIVLFSSTYKDFDLLLNDFDIKLNVRFNLLILVETNYY
jgi:hypothetical protein